MPGYFVRLAAIALLVYLGLFVWIDNHPGTPIAGLDTVVLGLAVLFLGIAFFVMLRLVFTGAWRVSRRNRCVRCGARIDPGLLYCAHHLEQARREMVDTQYQRRNRPPPGYVPSDQG
jgi:hypothetical protein